MWNSWVQYLLTPATENPNICLNDIMVSLKSASARQKHKKYTLLFQKKQFDRFDEKGPKEIFIL